MVDAVTVLGSNQMQQRVTAISKLTTSLSNLAAGRKQVEELKGAESSEANSLRCCERKILGVINQLKEGEQDEQTL